MFHIAFLKEVSTLKVTLRVHAFFVLRNKSKFWFHNCEKASQFGEISLDIKYLNIFNQYNMSSKSFFQIYTNVTFSNKWNNTFTIFLREWTRYNYTTSNKNKKQYLKKYVRDWPLWYMHHAHQRNKTTVILSNTSYFNFGYLRITLICLIFFLIFKFPKHLYGPKHSFYLG